MCLLKAVSIIDNHAMWKRINDTRGSTYITNYQSYPKLLQILWGRCYFQLYQSGLTNHGSTPLVIYTSLVLRNNQYYKSRTIICITFSTRLFNRRVFVVDNARVVFILHKENESVLGCGCNRKPSLHIDQTVIILIIFHMTLYQLPLHWIIILVWT